MILMDESELCDSPLNEEELRTVLNILGPKCKDKLLIPRVEDE